MTVAVTAYSAPTDAELRRALHGTKFSLTAAKQAHWWLNFADRRLGDLVVLRLYLRYCARSELDPVEFLMLLTRLWEGSLPDRKFTLALVRLIKNA